MEIRPYRTTDCREITELFYHTVHTINRRDYTEEQVNVWADGCSDLQRWNESLQEHCSVVAVDNGEIVGFGDLDRTGYLDRLYVHRDHQSEGIGSAICDHLELIARGTITTHASITARPFFERRGYQVVREQQVCRQGVFLTNYVMEKRRT